MDDDETNEPDEFARLLAQLNGTAAQAPEPQQQPPAPAPSYTPRPAPSPAPATAPPAPPAEAPAPQAAVAPAFGVAAPYPPLAGVAGGFTAAPPSTLSFPTVAPVPVSLPPEAPPLPRAPELMGADELAAPPRSFPPLDEPVPPLVSPPVADAPPYGAPAPSPELPQNPAPAYQPPPSSAPLSSAPLSSGPSSSMASAPAPSVPVLFVPDPAAPQQTSAGPAAYGGAPAASSTPLASPPRDFATLLATPVGGDDESRSAAGPLRFGSSTPDDDDDEPDLARSTAGEKLGLVLAILIAPIGLIVAIAAAARSARRRGWVVGIVRASIAIAIVLTLVWGVAGYYGYTQFKLQQAHDQTATASAAFCAAIKADPTMDQLPTFGWPAVAASIPDSLTAMQAYEDRWTKLAKVSPPGIKPGVTRMADAAKKIIDAVTVSRTVDDASNVSVMSSTASSSGVQAWYSEYCG